MSNAGSTPTTYPLEWIAIEVGRLANRPQLMPTDRSKRRDGSSNGTLGLVTGLSQGLGKLALDAIIQRDVPEVVRTSVFARSETLLQLSWVIGGFLGVFMPLNAKLGLSVVAVVLVAWSVFVLHGRLASARTQRRVS